MPKFLYTAVNKTTSETKGGEASAKDENVLARRLRADGFLLTSVKEEKEAHSPSVKFFDRFSSVPLKEKMIFARNLGVMISAGLPIAGAFEALSLQTKNKKFRGILLTIQKDIQSGESLAHSLGKYPGIFGDLFINMVRVGEVGGNLEGVLDIVATQLEKEHEIISKVRGAMMYPMVIVVAMIGLGVLMLTYILPKITSVFADMEVTLPATTRFIIGISDALKDHPVLIGIVFVVFAALGFLLARTSVGKIAASWAILRTPVVGSIAKEVNSARFTRIYSSLLRSGVPVVETLSIAARTLSNALYVRALEGAAREVQKGVALSDVIAKEKDLFPVLVHQIVKVGEDTGKSEEVLLKLAEFYEESIDRATKNLSSIIEPVLMLLIGGAVGFFAVAMLQPMYSVLENIQ